MADRADVAAVATIPTPSRFHLLAKPTGAACNLDCAYCFFLSKEALYPGGSRMSDATLEEYIRQLLESHRTPDVTVAWQGGEPTLMGLDFYRRSIELVEKHRQPWQRVEYTLQTNGVLLDDAWCAFLKENSFLVGLSVDGPRAIHDTYRVNRAGRGTFDQVMRGWSSLRRHGVEVNILCTVNAANQDHGPEVYRFFRDELEARWIQFIPVIERATPETLPLAQGGWNARPDGRRLLYTQSGTLVTERSVRPDGYGRFLCEIFDEWVRRDVGRIHVQLFDVMLHAYFGEYPLCIHAPTCGYGPALERNGDLYSCDHYVEPDYLLGNIHDTSLGDLVASPRQRQFGRAKWDGLTRQCLACDVRFVCNGGCPKDRFAMSTDGEAGHNYLCAGLREFFQHVREAMDVMAGELRHGRAPAGVMQFMTARDARLRRSMAEAGRNDLCPCGSGKKFKRCHGTGERRATWQRGSQTS